MPRHPLPILSLLALLALALVARRPVRATGGLEGLTVLVGGYELFGQLADGAMAAGPIQARLVAPGDTVRASSTVSPTLEGSFELAFVTAGLAERQPVIIDEGDRVVVTASGVTSELRVPALAATASDGTERVVGRAPPLAMVLVTAATPGGNFASRRVAADAGGQFAADFGDTLDLTPGSRGDVLLASDDVTWQTQWVIPDIEAAVGAGTLAVTSRPGAVLSARVAPATGPASARPQGRAVAWDGAAALWLGGPPIQAGDTITLTNTGGEATTWPIPNCSLNVVAADGAAWGECEPGRQLELTVPGGQRSATAGPDGRWSIALPPALLTPDTPVTITFRDAPYTRVVGYEPRVRQLDARRAVVTGQGTAGQAVGIVVHRRGQALGQGTGWVGPEGTFRLVARDAAGQAIPRTAGDTWHVTYGDLGLALPVAAVTAAADGGRRAVWGTAAPGDRIVVRAAGSEAEVFAGPDGSWSAQLGPAGGLAPGDLVEVLAGPVDGAVSHLSFPVFRANVQANGTRVRVEGHPGLEADAELDRAGDIIANGQCTVLDTTCDAVLRDDGGEPVALQVGDLVQVLPSDGSTAVVDVLPLTAHIDLGGRDVAGQAPPGSTVRIQFGHEPGQDTPLDSVAGSDETGVYDYELSATEWPALRPGLWADVYLSQGHGHRLFARAVLEVLRITPGAPEVRGLAEPGTNVEVTYARAAGIRGSGSAQADDDGRFVVVPWAGDTPLSIRPGDRIEMAHRRGTRQLTVEPLAAWQLAPAGSTAVLGGPRRTVRVTHRLADGLEEPVWVQDGWTDDAGELVLPPPPLAPTDWLAAAATLVLPGGDEIQTTVRPPAAAGRVALPRLGRTEP